MEFFTKHRKTHNAGVFDAYTPEMRACRSSHIITGLPDAYGRGRIIGDYRRVALYGVDRLIEDKKEQKDTTRTIMYSDVIREREELSEQIRALEELKELGEIYGFDISRPAKDVKEAIQWTYFGYLAAVKEQNGAAMSLGRTSTFLDIYAERDLGRPDYTEEQIQEFVDHFIMKLRLVKFARTPEYNALFSGDPTWVTESIGGVGIDGRHMVTKMSYRYLHTLENLGTAPEPNLTVLWSTRLPMNFKRFCAKTSIESSSIQYENDDLMRVTHGDDYAIACCVSSMRVGKEMQFFGARANLAKCLLYAINGGVDEISGKQVGPKYRPITSEYLDYDEVMDAYKDMMKWLAGVYVNALNIIHYNHDRYCYERLQMALHDKKVTRWFATGIAGLSVVADSLSAIKYAKVKTVRNEKGIVVDYEVEGDFPKYGNNDDRVDSDRRGAGAHLYELYQGQPHLPGRHPHHLHPDHHLQCGLRKEHRLHAGRKKGRASPLPPAPTPCTTGIPTERWPPWPPWPSCPLGTPRTASPTPSPSSPAPWARRIRFSWEIWKLNLDARAAGRRPPSLRGWMPPRKRMCNL